MDQLLLAQNDLNPLSETTQTEIAEISPASVTLSALNIQQTDESDSVTSVLRDPMEQNGDNENGEKTLNCIVFINNF